MDDDYVWWKKSQEIALMNAKLSIELDASKLYIVEVFYIVWEEINLDCYHTIVESISRDYEVSLFKFRNMLLNDELLSMSRLVGTMKHLISNLEMCF